MKRRDLLKTGIAGISTLAFAPATHAVESYLKASAAKKWAIVYGSQCGSTKEYAEFINEGLGGIADIIDIEKTTPKIEDYDFFIIGGWRSGNNVMPAKIPNFIKNNKSALKDKIKGMFAVVGNQGNPTLKPEMTTFLKNTLITPAGVNENMGKIFFGRYNPDCGKLGGNPYDNVKKEDGVDFGNKILADNNTGIFQTPSKMNSSLELYCSSGHLNRSLSVNYTLPVSGHVELTICSIHGQKFATLVSQYQEAGSYKVAFSGHKMTPGQYIYRLETGRFVKTTPATLLK